MMEKEYTIWLTFSGKENRRVLGIISQLSKKYSAPKFKPHMTLINGVKGKRKDVILKTEELASEIKKFQIESGSLNYDKYLVKCVFMKIKLSNQLGKVNITLKADRVCLMEDDCKHLKWTLVKKFNLA